MEEHMNEADAMITAMVFSGMEEFHANAVHYAKSLALATGCKSWTSYIQGNVESFNDKWTAGIPTSVCLN